MFIYEIIMRLKVAVAQIEHQTGRLEDSLAVHIDFIEQAKSKNIDILLFPETSLGGYGDGNQLSPITTTINQYTSKL